MPFGSLVNVLQFLETGQVRDNAELHAKSWIVRPGYDVSHLHSSGAYTTPLVVTTVLNVDFYFPDYEIAEQVSVVRANDTFFFSP